MKIQCIQKPSILYAVTFHEATKAVFILLAAIHNTTRIFWIKAHLQIRPLIPISCFQNLKKLCFVIFFADDNDVSIFQNCYQENLTHFNVIIRQLSIDFACVLRKIIDSVPFYIYDTFYSFKSIKDYAELLGVICT